MRVIGAIMEINPFHNGHVHFLNSINKNENDVLIVIISSTLVQRGEFCCIDKRVRTKLLLDHGVDVVLELPSVLAAQGGYYFAKHALHILEHFNITDLFFGSESNNIEYLRKYIPSNNNFATGIYRSELSNYLSNDILGISYIRNVSKNVKLTLVPRISNNYNDKVINNSKIQSATTIRNNLSDDNISMYMPNNVLENIKIIDSNLIFLLFINSLSKVNTALLLDPQMDLVNKSLKLLRNQENLSYDEFIISMADKNNSQHKIKRFMMNVIFSIKNVEFSYYYRVLGFNTKGCKYIKDFDYITTLKNNNSPLAIKEIEITKLYKQLTNNNQNLDFNAPVMPHNYKK